MAFGLSHLRIRTRIYAGFGVLIAVAVAVAAFGGSRLGVVGAEVGTMNEVADQRSRVTSATLNLETIRRALLRYNTDADAESLAQARNTLAETIGILEKSATAATSDERRRAYTSLQDQLRAYGQMADRLVALRTELTEERKKLFAGGDELTAATDRLVARAQTGEDIASTLTAADVTKAVLLVRVANWRFLATLDPKGPDTFKANRSAADQAVSRLDQMADEDTRKLIPPVKAALAAYASSFERVSSAMMESKKLFSDQMIPAMAAMQKALGDAQTSLGEHFAQVKQASDETIGSATWMQTAATGLALVLGVVLALVIGRGIVGPLTGMTAAMRRLADGDTSTDVPYRDGTDEIGDMARAVEVFKANSITAADLAAAQAMEQAAKESRQQVVDAEIAKFDHSVRDLLDMLASAATEMQSAAESMSATANQTTEQATTVAAAAEQASANVQTMAAATEEMAVSANEITRQVARSTQIAGRAVEAARQTDRQVQGLTETAQKIEDVVAIINGIAGQTNLLALNATIEAARAGDAGKGFAVVASEVKALAGQTGKATEQIGAQIQAIQSATKEAVEAIKAIGGTINEINDISTSIAAAMEEQGATTGEMTRNTQQAAQGTLEVSSTIGGVSQGANATGEAATQVLSAAAELGRKAETLRAEVGGFLTKIRAA